MSALRPLPSRPSLEYEHKAAKALLRRLRAADPDAVARARARHPAFDVSLATRIKLADAQLVIAREYGFASWPRLAQWFADAERLRHAYRQLHGTPHFYEAMVAGWRRALAARRPMVGRAIAASVPRFYGLPADAAFDAALDDGVSDDELRLAIARQHGAPSWEELMERVAAIPSRYVDEWEPDPRSRAMRAIVAADLDTLRAVADAHPELLRQSDETTLDGRSLLTAALRQERKRGADVMRPIVDWLASHGFDLQRELNVRLCGHMNIRADTVRWLLERGADPDWVAPSGVPVLEHALLRYWNGEAVDVLAARARRRDALWIAAGLADLATLRRFLDRDGKPIAAARRLRPPLDVAAPWSTPSLPEPDDEELLVETLLVAMLNGRTAVIEWLAPRGAPVNSCVHGGIPLVTMAVGNRWTSMVECLVRCGADLDLPGANGESSAREQAREMFEQSPDDADRRRIVELCGMSAAAVLAARDARPAEAPAIDPSLERAIALAGDDAARAGRDHVDPEHLLVGLLRAGGLPLTLFTRRSGMDFDRFREEMRARVRPTDGDVASTARPLSVDARAAMGAAIVLATERRRDTVHGLHLLDVLLRDQRDGAGALLERYGGSAAPVRAELARML